MLTDDPPSWDDRRPELPIEAYRALQGQQIGVSDWVLVDQARIDAFADVTMDWQPIHIDAEAGARSPFGTRVAHGFLTLSLLSALASRIAPRITGTAVRINYGFDRVRFVRPVPSGARIRGRFTLVEVAESTPGAYRSTFDVTVEIEGQAQPALVARWISFANSHS
jgi:acyl dehydratase